jgi:hypothetical protein
LLASDQFANISTRCPTFSWQLTMIAAKKADTGLSFHGKVPKE